MTDENIEISWLGTIRTFLKLGTCSETLINVLDRAYADPLRIEEHGSMPLAGGIMQHGYQCGALWGATLAAGARAYRLFGASPQAETQAINAAQRLAASLRARHKSIDCREITGISWRSKTDILKYFLKGGPIACFHLVAKYAPVAFEEINTALDEKHVEATSAPVSCAALLARKMGASDMQAIMAAGFAGGIGLSGGGCGALGAAIWIIEMNSRKENAEKSDFSNPRAKEAIRRFLNSTDHQFECKKIVGRRFENINDHAEYLRNGGCAKIIEALSGELGMGSAGSE